MYVSYIWMYINLSYTSVKRIYSHSSITTIHIPLLTLNLFLISLNESYPDHFAHARGDICLLYAQMPAIFMLCHPIDITRSIRWTP